MFTGLVEEMGMVRSIVKTADSFTLTIGAKVVLDGVKFGDSINVNGVCLSVTDFSDDEFTVGLAPETLKRTSLGQLVEGDRINLERSATPQTRLGGHYVQGHVDATGEIVEFREDADALWVTIRTSPELMKYIVIKGYITIDGTSLTVVDTGADWFNVTLIAHTQELIVLPRKKSGDLVNLEVDIIAKYVEKLVAANAGHTATPSQTQLASKGGQ
ncbi:riboflavin synthase [Parvularcula flava]|uniref:Riboflavin synthase n=1 Tax=Aquisalinus luteolus TaxID=1566827 RepID=A0A8J3ERD9_9PROT|nr:riboflavin synthase [Aquisalinus luteolus]NHK28600.1 riboflavin synthase [Aquisalinus luteolus]GGH98964.1 riboflavin synthase subunit alpha [Aquisalinus luteolus]